MSGYNNPLGGHRGQFNPQQQQQMNQMTSNTGIGIGMHGAAGGSVGGYPPTSGIIGQQQQQQQQTSMPVQMGMPSNMGPGVGSGMGAVGGVGIMNPIGMQSPSHIQQQQLMQQQQMQMQQGQQQQPILPSGSSQMNMAGQAGSMTSNMPSGGGGAGQSNLMQQQQTQQSAPNPLTSTSLGTGSPATQQQQQQVPTSQPSQTASSMLAISQPNLPHKEINIVALSRLGQETVQDITSRFQEIFSALKIIAPTANRDNNTEKKVQEYFRTIRLLFKRVRIIYEKCNDGYPQGMEYAHVESLIPYKDEPDHRIEPTQCEEYRKALQENQELIETVKLKNRQLREIIDRTRIIIWEINTMLSMRRS